MRYLNLFLIALTYNALLYPVYASTKHADFGSTTHPCKLYKIGTKSDGENKEYSIQLVVDDDAAASRADFVMVMVNKQNPQTSPLSLIYKMVDSPTFTKKPLVIKIPGPVNQKTNNQIQVVVFKHACLPENRNCGEVAIASQIVLKPADLDALEASSYSEDEDTSNIE